MESANRRRVVFGAVAAILLVIFLEVFLMVRDDSPSYDEHLHLHSGYMQWKHGCLLLNPSWITRLMARTSWA